MNDLSSQILVTNNSMYNLPIKMQDGNINLKGFGTTEYVARWIQGEDMGDGGIDKPTAPYVQVVWVYRAIRLLANSAKMLPIRISKEGDREAIIESGKAHAWWNQDKKSARELINQTVGHKQLTGECHWIYEGSGANTSIGFILGRHQIKLKLNGNKTEIQFWIIKDGKKDLKILPDELVSDIDWSPYNKWRGASPLDAGALAISQDYQASRHNEKNLQNNAEPSGMLSTDQEIDPEDAKEIQRFWNENHSGNKNRGKVGITWGGLKWQQTASSMRDMLFDKLKMMSANEIVSGVFGIPPVMVGINKDSNYGFAEAGRKIFWADVMPPIIADFSEMATEFTTKNIQPGVEVWLDLRASQVFSEMQQERYKLLQPLLDSGVTLNDVNEKLQLGFNENEWGDESWISQSMVPRRFILEQEFANEDEEIEPEVVPDNNITPAEGDESEDDGTDVSSPRAAKALNAKRGRLWRAWVTSWSPLQRKADQQLRSYFKKWEAEILSLLPESVKEVAPVNIIPVDFFKLLGNQALKDKELQSLMKPMLEKGVEFGVVQAATDIGADITSTFAQTDNIIRAVLNQKVIKLVEINRTVREKIRTKVRKAINDSLDASETVTQRAVRVEKALKGSMKQTRSRALTIARTEIAQSVSTGRHRAYVKSGIAAKHRWISARDEHVRDTHIKAEQDYGTIAKAIDMSQKFAVGTALLAHPSDPSGPAGEIINCRCVEIIVREKSGRDISEDYYLEKGFVSWNSQ